MDRDKPSLTSGLDAILKLRHNDVTTDRVAEEKLSYIDIGQLIPGEFQPRKHFSKEDLQGLAASIQAQGILQPIIVRSREGRIFEIIAGERRWQAAKLAGLKEVPVIIKEISDSVAAAFSLVENIQRKNLNPLEEATALQRLYHEFKLSHEQIAHTVGRSRVAVTNIMRLLNLHEKVKQYLSEEVLSMGHARALISLERHEQERVCDLIIKKALSVRQTEVFVQQLSQPLNTRVKEGVDLQLQEWQQQLTKCLHTDLTLKKSSRGKYCITLKIASKEALAKLVNRLKRD